MTDKFRKEQWEHHLQTSLPLWCHHIPSGPSWPQGGHPRFFLSTVNQQAPSMLLEFSIDGFSPSHPQPYNILLSNLHYHSLGCGHLLLPELPATSLSPCKSTPLDIARKVFQGGHFSSLKPLKDVPITPRPFPSLWALHPWQLGGCF